MIYVLLVDGFEEVEAITPIDILRRCGAEVKTVGVNKKTVCGSHNICVSADIMFDEIDKQAMEMLILPGGPGHGELKCDKVYDLINFANDKKYIGAICAAPSILGEMGLLKDKKATCFPGFEDMLLGAEVSSEKCVTDGKTVTAKGAGAASEFGFALAELVCGKAQAEKIKNAMQY